jgi:hypothetical protein
MILTRDNIRKMILDEIRLRLPGADMSEKVNIIVDRASIGQNIPMRQWEIAPFAYGGGHKGYGEEDVWEFRESNPDMALKYRDRIRNIAPDREWVIILVNRQELDKELLRKTEDGLEIAKEEAGRPVDPYSVPVYILRNPEASELSEEE